MTRPRLIGPEMKPPTVPVAPTTCFAESAAHRAAKMAPPAQKVETLGRDRPVSRSARASGVERLPISASSAVHRAARARLLFGHPPGRVWPAKLHANLADECVEPPVKWAEPRELRPEPPEPCVGPREARAGRALGTGEESHRTPSDARTVHWAARSEAEAAVRKRGEPPGLRREPPWETSEASSIPTSALAAPRAAVPARPAAIGESIAAVAAPAAAPPVRGAAARAPAASARDCESLPRRACGRLPETRASSVATSGRPAEPSASPAIVREAPLMLRASPRVPRDPPRLRRDAPRLRRASPRLRRDALASFRASRRGPGTVSRACEGSPRTPCMARASCPLPMEGGCPIQAHASVGLRGLAPDQWERK
jgi:hypothetical protein